MKVWMLAAACGVLLAGGVNRVQAGEHRLGGGANYWVALKDLGTDKVDDDGFSYLASYQYRTGLFGVEVDAEFLPDRFGSDAWAPEAYLLLGRTIFAGAGIGIINTDGEFANDPFYALKAGLEIEVLPRIYVDISGNYRFNDKAELENSDTNIDSDTIFVGAAVRWVL